MTPQQSIGHYRIVSKLGEGGMGAVYRATDTRLNRDVALKVLTEALANDADYLARFTREAQVLASLNHPNIAQIYGIEQGAIVMELVDGRTLEGQFPIETVIDYGRQIAEALEAAHEKGVVHRDLKPANVKVTPDGVIKVLDFGLAKAIESTAAASTANSPTLTLRSTQLGVIMGTAGYMAPEQAAGKPVDKRADIWAFGVVLYEMLTGAPLFGGETVAHTLADVLRAPIDLGKLPSDTPANVRSLIERCLDRNIKTRLRDIGEARIALSTPAAAPPTTPVAKRSRVLPIVVTAAALVGILDFVARYFTASQSPTGAVTRFSLTAPKGVSELPTGAAPMWIPSPDGRYIAFPTAGNKPMLWIRELGSLEARPLPKAANANFPFWSPDSQSIGYFGATAIERVSVADGSTRTICETGRGVYNRSGGGGAWSSNGTVVFQLQGGLQQCPASGGSPKPATELDAKLQEITHTWPQFLPDGKHFLYLARSENPENCAIYVQELGSNTRVRLLTNLSRAMWAPPGWLLFARDDNLLAQRFDLKTLRLEGEPVTAEPSITVNDANGRSAFAASMNGVLISRPAGGTDLALSWRDRSGRPLREVKLGGFWSNLRVSPDEKLASLNQTTRHPTLTNTYILDLTTGVPVRAVFDTAEDEDGAAWSPMGNEIAYTRRGGTLWRQAPGSPTATEIPAGIPAGYVRDWSPDGKRLIVTDESGSKTHMVSVADGKAQQVLDLPVRRTTHRISPDGKWIAVTLGGTDRTELWLATFPEFGNRRQISVNGGSFPVWRKDSRELFYLEPDGGLMSIVFQPEPSIPRRLFKLFGVRRGYIYAHLSNDQFLVLENATGEAQGPSTVTLNWTLGLKP